MFAARTPPAVPEEQSFDERTVARCAVLDCSMCGLTVPRGGSVDYVCDEIGRYRFVGIGVSEWRVTDPADSFAHVEWLEQFGVSAAQVPPVRPSGQGGRERGWAVLGRTAHCVLWRKDTRIVAQCHTLEAGRARHGAGV